MMTIRQIVPTDARLLSHLHGCSFDRGWCEAEMARLFSRSGTFGFLAAVAQAPSEAKAFILCWQISLEECEILSLAVLPPFRRTGLARALCHEAVLHSTMQGIKTLFLEVAASNEAAQRLYDSLGFTICNHRKNYYRNADGSREDALTMQLLLQ